MIGYESYLTFFGLPLFSLLFRRSIVVVGRLCNSRIRFCHSVLINRYAVVKDEELFCCRINILPPAATLGTYQNIIQHRVNCFTPFQLNFSAKVLCYHLHHVLPFQYHLIWYYSHGSKTPSSQQESCGCQHRRLFVQYP